MDEGANERPQPRKTSPMNQTAQKTTETEKPCTCAKPKPNKVRLRPYLPMRRPLHLRQRLRVHPQVSRYVASRCVMLGAGIDSRRLHEAAEASSVGFAVSVAGLLPCSSRLRPLLLLSSASRSRLDVARPRRKQVLHTSRRSTRRARGRPRHSLFRRHLAPGRRVLGTVAVRTAWTRHRRWRRRLAPRRRRAARARPASARTRRQIFGRTELVLLSALAIGGRAAS